MSEIVVLDNVLPLSLFKKITEVTVDNPNFNFSVIETSLPTDKLKSFAAVAESPWEKMFFSVPLWMAASKLDLSLQDVYRIRFGLLHRDITQVINTPHVDNPYDHHYVGIYYLNDTDGSTKIWEEKHTHWGIEAKKLHHTDCNLLKEISPKANRMIIFDGEHYHSSTLPTQTQLRYTINYNFSKKR